MSKYGFVTRRWTYITDLFEACNPNPANKIHFSAVRDPQFSEDAPDNLYRVKISKYGSLEVMCLGLGSVDSDLEGEYASTDDLPRWVQERLAVLMMIENKPPLREVAGVGRRISEYVFWVYAPDTCTGASLSA